MNGLLILDKPQGFTSFDVVAVMRRICGQKKIGHTGTLDPMATGVLPLLLGTATRAQSLAPNTDKEYEAGFRLGLTTDTQDITGTIREKRPVSVARAELEAAAETFRGEILQVPPMFSAVQRDGVRLYDLARRGIEVEREARPVVIHRLDVLRYEESTGEGTMRVRCSKGTYIRTLCHDIGEKLGCGGVMTSLRRTAACGFLLSDSVTLEEARALAETGRLMERVTPVDGLFARYPAVRVSTAQAKRFANGGALDLIRTSVSGKSEDGARMRVYAPDKRFLGLGAVDLAKAQLKVLKLFDIK